VANLISHGNEVHTIMPHRLLNLKSSEVFTAVIEGIEQDLESLFVTRIVDTVDRLEIELLGERKQFYVRPGDVVQGGLHIAHARFGAEATHIRSFILRLVCSNGMMRRQCVSRRRPRARKLSVNHPNAHALELNQVRRLSAEVWQSIAAKLEAHDGYLQARISAGTQMMDRLLGAWHVEGAGEHAVWRSECDHEGCDARSGFDGASATRARRISRPDGVRNRR